MNQTTTQPTIEQQALNRLNQANEALIRAVSSTDGAKRVLSGATTLQTCLSDDQQ